MLNKRHSGTFRHIHAYSSISTHIQVNSGIIMDIQVFFRHIQNHLSLESWYIEKSDICRTRGILRTFAYSEPETHSEP